MAASQLAHRLKSLENLFLARGELQRQKRVAVPQVEKLSATEFYERYYFSNEAVVIKDVAAAWGILDLWTPEYLSREFGDVDVEIQTNRSSDPDYEINLDSHRTRMNLGKFISAISNAETNDFYMCANNRAFEDRLLPLFQQIPQLGFMEPHSPQHTFLWLGPKGTVTPLHYDVMNVLFVQIRGRKQITIAPPEVTPLMYNRRGVFSDVDYTRPDYVRFPLFKRAQLMTVTLEPGQGLFIPVGWWHFVRSLDISISVSFTSFRHPNQFQML